MSTLIGDHFQAGETLLTCHAWISSVNVVLRDIVCANCFTHVSKLPQPGSMKKCSACKAVSYCGEKCQEPHWKEEHKVECGFMKRLIGSKEGRLLFPSQKPDEVEQDHHGPDIAHVQRTRKMMVLKLVNKIIRGSTEDSEFSARFEAFLASKFVYHNGRPPLASGPVNGYNGNRSVKMDMFGHIDRFEEPEYRPIAMAAFGLTLEEYREKLGSKFNLEEFYQRFRCWGSNIFISESPHAMVGDTFYLETTQMNISCEPNSTFTGKPKTLVIRAVEPISKPLRLADCKTAFHQRVMGNYPFPTEVEQTLACYGKFCSGKYCTPKYHAEMLPLRCSNTSCDQPLPSDDRALQPCPKCKSVLRLDCLKTGQLRLNLLDIIYKDALKSPTERIIQLRSDPVVHPDNLFVVLVITGSLGQLASRLGYLWSTIRVMLPFIRKCYPKNDQTLAALLGTVADDYKHLAEKSDRQLEEGMKIFREAYEIQMRIGVKVQADIERACNWYGIVNRTRGSHD